MGGYCNSLIDGNALGRKRDLYDWWLDCNSLIDGNALGPQPMDKAAAVDCNSLIDGNALGLYLSLDL